MKKLIVISIALLLSACNMSASISEINDSPIVAPLSLKANGAALNSGAKVHMVSTGGYIVDSSVGNIQSQITATASGGYKVYMNLDGQLASE
jgi:hypothetical protein